MNVELQNNRDTNMKAPMNRSSLFATIALVALSTTLNLPALLLNPASLTAIAADATTQKRINGTLDQDYTMSPQSPAIAATAEMKVSANTLVIPAQAQVNLSTTQQVALKDELSPFNLAYLAYQGYFKDQKIPSNGALISATASGQITAQNLIQAAVKGDRLPASKLQDQSYRHNLEDQLKSLIDD
jgi:hypothetical protein